MFYPFILIVPNKMRWFRFDYNACLGSLGCYPPTADHTKNQFSYYSPLCCLIKYLKGTLVNMACRYRVSHETWQLVNNFKCLLPHTVLNIKDKKKYLTRIYFTVKSILTLVSNKLSNYGRRHFKLFKNCHVPFDTLYLKAVFTIILNIFLYKVRNDYLWG